MTRHVVSVILYEISDTDIPWNLLTHIGNMVFCSVEVGSLTNVCKKQNFNEWFLHNQTKSHKIQPWPASLSPKGQEKTHYHNTTHQARKGRGTQNLPNSQMRLTVFSPYRPTRHPNMTIFVPVYSGWTQGTWCIANHSQIQCWWGAVPSPSLCDPSVLFGTKSGPQKWVAIDLYD